MLENNEEIGNTKQKEALGDVLLAARTEAAEWRLDIVELWDPSELVLEALKESRVNYELMEREENQVPSIMRYGVEGEEVGPPTWLNNEHYAWC